MKKQYLLLLTLLLIALGAWLILRTTQSPAPQGAAAESRSAPDPTGPAAPSIPFDSSELQAGDRVSAASIESMKTRAGELREAASQLDVKMKSIEERLADPAQAANTAALREAKQALEFDRQKMRLEETALADFLRNELKEDAPPGP